MHRKFKYKGINKGFGTLYMWSSLEGAPTMVEYMQIPFINEVFLINYKYSLFFFSLKGNYNLII